jgi:vesicle-associated membrane protein 7
MASSSSPPTPLLYACIAHNTTILSEHTASATSQTSSLASLVLPKITHTSAQKLTYTHNQNFIHYIADAPSEYSSSEASAGGLTYLVVADSSLGRRIPFGFLVEIKKRFQSQYPPASTDFASLPNYGAGSFNSELKKLMVEYGTTEGGKKDAIQNVQGEIDNVRGIMSQNIENLLERGERIDLLVDKTDRLGGSAHDFRVRSRGLRRRMWWKNVKLMALLTVVVVFLIYLFVGFGCGLPGWSKCVGSGK